MPLDQPCATTLFGAGRRREGACHCQIVEAQRHRIVSPTPRHPGPLALLADLHRTTHAEDGGCLAHDFYRRADNPREYVVFEQWRDADGLACLARVYGAPPPGTRLPASFIDRPERAEAVRYEPAR
jgi:hypothetical protein